MSFRAKLLLFLAIPSFAAGPNEELFQARILPVLEKNCQGCHSAKNQSGGLALSTFDQLITGGKHGSALMPGDPEGSLLIQHVRGTKSPKMPLGGELPAGDVEALVAAIREMKPTGEKKAADPHLSWLLTAPKRAPLPAVKAQDWVRNPIDAFVLARLESKGWAPAPPASRRALIRRVYFDLVGLPPAPDEVETFIADTAEDAYEKVIDRLLADSRYGERWARHWLDLARYAESDGFAIDGERPTAWRYRDYVIRSFNKDKPYDLFIKEQLAGDEMNDKRTAGDARSERLAALGFLRMGTWEADANFKTQLRQDFLNEVTATASQVFLGLTVGCARCHDHKYDPIPQRDFYRFQAFFAATRVEERPAPYMPVEDPALMKRMMREYEDQAELANAEFKKIEDRMKQTYASARKLKAGDKAIDDFRKALKDRKDITYTEAERKEFETARDRARQLTDAMPRYRPVAYSVADVVPPHVPEVASTYVLAGGELANRGDKVEPGFLQCVIGKSEDAKIPFAGGSSGRRAALADWIASPENPVTARVMVNRIWQHHFGEGLARTPSDFGKNGDRPSHPELLDWLAVEFSAKKFSMKAMHKLMLMSNTYQQSTSHPEWKRYAEEDPGNRLLSRMNWLRLEAEVLRDSMLALSGRLEKSTGGPGVFLDIPTDVAEGFEFFKWFASDDKEQRKRTVYTFQRRSVMNQMVEVFDGANMSESCSRRGMTTVAPQAFTLLNGAFTNTEARHFAKRVIGLAGSSPETQVERAFQLALSRLPAPPEKQKAIELYANAGPEEALTRLGVVLMNLNEFLYLE